MNLEESIRRLNQPLLADGRVINPRSWTLSRAHRLQDEIDRLITGLIRRRQFRNEDQQLLTQIQAIHQGCG